MTTSAEAERSERERLFRNWCKTKRLDPETTEAAVAYEEWVVQWESEEVVTEWDAYRSVGIQQCL